MSHLGTVIVGAGMAGLTLARRLQDQGRSFSILEKSRSVGGRMATRRDGDVVYDHGAQFYKTGRSADLPFDAEFSRANLAHLWFVKEGQGYKAAVGGITQLAKSLALGMDILLNHQLARIGFEKGEIITLEMTDGRKFTADRLYLTCPLPQSLKILTDSKIPFPVHLQEIHYAKALVGLFAMDSQSPMIQGLAYRQPKEGNIFSIANQQSKKVSPGLAFAVTMTPTWSERFFEEEESASLSQVQAAFDSYLRAFTTDPFRITKSTLKKWRYSHPLNKPAMMFETIGNNITLLGDAFGGASLGGAAASASAVPI